MKLRLAIVAMLAAFIVGGDLGLAREPQGQNGISAEPLLAEAFAGDPNKEVNAQLYTFLPGVSTVMASAASPGHETTSGTFPTSAQCP